MSLDDESAEYIHQKLYRSKGKCAIYARQTDVYVEPKLKSITNARIPATTMAGSPNAIDIGAEHDVWFHIAMRLDPEDVQRFGLVCKQFAHLVNSRVFWRNMYRRYCLKSGSSKAWNLQLPAQLQLEQTRNCDTKTLRSLVTEAFFHCYRPLKERLELGYSLDWLLQRSFVSCTQNKYPCLWIVCYTLSNKQSNHIQFRHGEQEVKTTNDDVEVVNDWEALANDEATSSLPSYNYEHRHEGVVLLIVLCRQYMPLPLQLLYNQQQSRFRVKATREMLCTDMRAKNLELDFVDDNNSNSKLSVTVKYSRIEKYKVLPWWHPDFKRFFK
ncbi:transmembrane protein 183 [Drosophila sulfurigaster albostrigata]|uniref:transmembrane protein 183 n=1 Tax=Drosophila sulfurigaster albostrigata TaxID=89887 RepID=UPI002D21A04C|nr:transmembrane protein 183 [Drosophila sulfurigaster albostrigata]